MMRIACCTLDEIFSVCTSLRDDVLEGTHDKPASPVTPEMVKKFAIAYQCLYEIQDRLPEIHHDLKHHVSGNVAKVQNIDFRCLDTMLEEIGSIKPLSEVDTGLLDLYMLTIPYTERGLNTPDWSPGYVAFLGRKYETVRSKVNQAQEFLGICLDTVQALKQEMLRA